MATGKEIKEVYDMMQKICDETSLLINVINDMMMNKGCKAVGDGSVMWDKSNHFLYPGYWLPYFMQRIYIKEPNTNRAIGFNIIFNGSVDGLENKIPFLTCGAVDFPGGKAAKGNALYFAGWTDDEEIVKEFMGSLCTTTYKDGVKATTYFLPLEALSSQEQVDRLVIEPLLQLYEGNLQAAESMVQASAIGLAEIIE